MEIKVIRKYYTLKSTISEVYINDTFFCHCLEDRVRTKSAPKVFGESAIPAGRYQVIYTMSNRFKIKMPLLLNVPGYEGVRIHCGSYPTDTLGCLLLGHYDPKTPDFINESRITIGKFYPLIEKAYQSNEKIFIQLVDTQEPVKDIPKTAKKNTK